MSSKPIIRNERVHCPECDKSVGKLYFNTHNTKMHTQCNICQEKFTSVKEMTKHKGLKQSKAAIKISNEEVKKKDIVKMTNPWKECLETEFKCEHCDIKFKTKQEMFEHRGKNHIYDNWPESGSKRDVSMVKTSSMSEPKKKKLAEEEEMKLRSEQMDRKIIEKIKREELEEMLSKKALEENKRRAEEESALEKKRIKKQKEKEKSKQQSTCDTVYQQSNVKELPNGVKCMYPDSLEYCVAGDGACCLKCLAAWIYLDSSQGPLLGRDLNTHLAEYRPYYREKIVFPLTITVAGGQRKTFDIGEENDFFDYLVESPQASFIWRESADMIGLTNFTQMEIEVVVYNQITDKVEETQVYNPDFCWSNGDANAPNRNKYPKMRLINYKNVHFNLILHKNYPLLSTKLNASDTTSTNTHNPNTPKSNAPNSNTSCPKIPPYITPKSDTLDCNTPSFDTPTHNITSSNTPTII